MPHIFTYGSLMFDQVWSRLVSGDYDRCEAILTGYDRKGVQDEVYPVIVPSDAASQVKGIVYLDVSSADLARLDRFEGEYYFRAAAGVVTLDQTVLEAETYVLKEEYYAIISPRHWDPEHFLAAGIHRLMPDRVDRGKQ